MASLVNSIPLKQVSFQVICRHNKAENYSSVNSNTLLLHTDYLWENKKKQVLKSNMKTQWNVFNPLALSEQLYTFQTEEFTSSGPETSLALKVEQKFVNIDSQILLAFRVCFKEYNMQSKTTIL